MKNSFSLLVSLFLILQFSSAQNLYFPPNSGNTWATLDPSELGWCADKLDDLYQFLDEKNSKAFIILKDGKIVVERYFDSFTKDSLWYYASSGKSITSVLVGIAKQENLLALDDKTSKYLGAGWTSAPPEKEDLITIRHQLSMTAGLDENEEDLNGTTFCLDPACLKYKADAGTRWAYHNAPYLLLQNVLEAASGQSYNLFYYNRLANKIGMSGLWVGGHLYGKPRDAARFGLFALANGNWNGQQILSDAEYLRDMKESSQQLNKSYGYLWWLNGKDSFMIPVLRNVFNGSMMPDGPADMYVALGKNDQKIYVVPGESMVVVRMGDSARESAAAITVFDNELWQKINELDCITSVESLEKESVVTIFPNPAGEKIRIETGEKFKTATVFSLDGKVVLQQQFLETGINELDISALPNGAYWLLLLDENGRQIRQFVKK